MLPQKVFVVHQPLGLAIITAAKVGHQFVQLVDGRSCCGKVNRIGSVGPGCCIVDTFGLAGSSTHNQVVFNLGRNVFSDQVSKPSLEMR